MKPIKSLFLFLFLLSVLVSCKQAEREITGIQTLNHESIEAINPYFTNDQDGNAVLCWTAKDSSGNYHLKYAIYDVDKNSFSDPVTVSEATNLSTSPESMGKVAFKADGNVIAIYGKKIQSEESPYASAIYYSISTDKGLNWTTEELIHSDTSTNVGHSFFDITRLKDGEIAAIWLDGRFGKTEKGSALFFAKTQKGTGFATDTLLDKNTCECCRTEIISDDAGNVHIAYRGINFPSGMFGKQVRDMVYLSSTDGGKTFSHPQAISNDNWVVEGCPHTGPSLAVHKQQVNAVWFTAGGATGLYYTSSLNDESKFKERKLVSSSGRHPQMAASPNGKLAIVFEDDVNEELNDSQKESSTHLPMNKNHNTDHSNKKMDHSSMEMNHSKTGETRIVLHLMNGEENKTINITDGLQADHHAVIQSFNDNSFLIAWVHEKDGKAFINYSKYF